MAAQKLVITEIYIFFKFIKNRKVTLIVIIFYSITVLYCIFVLGEHKQKHLKNLPTQNQNFWTVVYFCPKAFRKVQITWFL